MTTEEPKKDYIQKKLNKILETRYDTDKNIVESLKHLSTFFDENTLETRRNLRSQIEKRSLEINKNFLAAFHEVKESLDGICSDVDSMNDSVDRMRNCLKNTQDQTHELIKQTNELQTARIKMAIHQDVATSMINHFQLSVSDHAILYSNREEKITPEFFQVLDHVQSIHNECRLLMQNGYETLALDIMEEMTLHQEAALERLYRWTQNHCRSVDTANDAGLMVIEAMSRLQDRPVLFKYVIDEYSTNRRAVLVKKFIDALTTGDSGNKPIEMHAHDPKRYIGDILAWLHQAIHSERENLMMLCKSCDKNDISEIILQALANISDGVCHTLKSRVEMILNSEKDTIILYSIANLIRFYFNIINSVIKCGQLEKCLHDIQSLSENFYLSSLTLQVKEILQSSNESQLSQADLVPPQSVRQLLNILKEILSVANMVEGRQVDIQKIVSCVVDPLLQSLTEQAIHLPCIDMSVYFLNFLYQIQSALAMYEFMDERLERLNAQCDAQIETLTSEQASSIVANLNLGPIYTVLQSEDSNKFDTHHLKLFMNKLNAFIEMPEVLILPQVNLLQSSTHRTTVQRRALNVIIAIYKQLYERIHSGDYHRPEQLLSKTPEQVAEMLCG